MGSANCAALPTANAGQFAISRQTVGVLVSPNAAVYKNSDLFTGTCITFKSKRLKRDRSTVANGQPVI